MILEGIKIMVIGMTTVFIMLGTLVIATYIVSQLTKSYVEKAAEKVKEGKPIAAILAAAVGMFRKKV